MGNRLRVWFSNRDIQFREAIMTNKIQKLTTDLEKAKLETQKAEDRLQKELKRLADKGDLVIIEGEPHRVFFSRGKYRTKSALSRYAKEQLRRSR